MKMSLYRMWFDRANINYDMKYYNKLTIWPVRFLFGHQKDLLEIFTLERKLLNQTWLTTPQVFETIGLYNFTIKWI